MTVADIDADGMNDIVTCHDLRTWYGVGEYVPDNCDDGADCKPSLAPWAAHLWRPNGFESTERHIEALDGVSCWMMNRFFGAVDWNADGQTDLVTLNKDARWQTHTFNVSTLQWESQTLSVMLANVLTIQYANLVDGTDTYAARFDAGNSCEYPRACVVGGAAVASAYIDEHRTISLTQTSSTV